MVNFREIFINGKAVAFLKHILSGGKTMSKHVLENCNWEMGRVNTYLPDSTDSTALNEFAIGGKIPDLNVGEEKGTETDKWLTSKIRSFLTKGENRLCIFENSLAKPTDAWLHSKKVEYFSFGEEVYHFLTEPTEDKIAKAIANAMTYLFIGFMTSVAQEVGFPKPLQNVSSSELESFAKRTEKIIIGAYDNEGYLIWNKECE